MNVDPAEQMVQFLMPEESQKSASVCSQVNEDLEANNEKADIKRRLHHFWTVTVHQVRAMHVEEIDRAQEDDPQQVAEYCGPIIRHLQQVETQNLPSQSYMGRQGDINEKMRGILVDWIIEVHLRFKLLPETLFLTINLIDRYLEKTQIMRTRLQLVAVAALLIASKYEEIYVPDLNDFVFISDNAYTREEIIEMERSMLVKLEFSITTPSSYRFL